MSDDDALFDADPYIDGATLRPVSALRALHDAGAPLLDALVPAGRSVVLRRVRDAADVEADPRRLDQVTLRVKTAGGKVADEWRDLHNTWRGIVAYGWLHAATGHLEAYALLDAENLAEDVTTRPGCLVVARNGRTTVHHAPGGAEFVVVDLRRIRPETVVASYGSTRWGTEPAPIAIQEELL